MGPRMTPHFISNRNPGRSGNATSQCTLAPTLIRAYRTDRCLLKTLTEMPPYSPSASAPLVRSLRLPSPSPLLPRTLPSSHLSRLRLPSFRRRLLLSVSTAVRAMASEGGEDHRLPRIASTIRVIPDFPKPGRPPILMLEGVS
ncbi:hypothetical protein BHM03_00014557 [Ensete ventricosum]|nr:hypothetical protein BHM03_00014557 [Ensete ventricosum]